MKPLFRVQGSLKPVFWRSRRIISHRSRGQTATNTSPSKKASQLFPATTTSPWQPKSVLTKDENPNNNNHRHNHNNNKTNTNNKSQKNSHINTNNSGHNAGLCGRCRYKLPLADHWQCTWGTDVFRFLSRRQPGPIRPHGGVARSRG